MQTTRFLLASEDATIALATAMTRHVQPGDALLLTGDLGAGKTFFARAFIQAVLAEEGRVEDVPSPTFTLVQTYETRRGEIWHADLYRLGAPEEVAELGLADAFATVITLVEWPDRLGSYQPERFLEISLAAAADDARHVTLRPTGSGWDWIQALPCGKAA